MVLKSCRHNDIKTVLVTRDRYIQVVKSQPYQGSFENTHSKMKTNIRLWMYKWNGTVWYPICPVWLSISRFKPESRRPLHTSGKSQPCPDYFLDTHSQMKTNIRLWMYTWNGTLWYLFCLVWSSISCFMDENVSHKSLMCISGKITTVPRLFWEQSL